MGELSVLLEGNFYDDFTQSHIGETFAGETWHLWINDGPEEHDAMDDDMPDDDMMDEDMADDGWRTVT